MLFTLGSSHVLASAALPLPEAVQPGDGARTVVFHPSFSWSLPPQDGLSVRIQIARDGQFESLTDSDLIHSVVDWYVPAERLEPGTFWWRIRTEDDDGQTGEWSAPRRFSVVDPEQTFVISAQTSLAEMREIAVQAAREKSALIRFEKGTYRFRPGFEETVFKWAEAGQIVLDGGGSLFIMEEPSAQLWHLENCRNILIGNFSFEYDPRPHTIARVSATDPEQGTLDADMVEGFSEARYPRTVNQMFAYALDPADTRRLHPDRPGHLFLDPEKTVKLGETGIRYVLPHPEEFPLLKQIQAGDLIVVCYRRWPLSYVKCSTDVTLFNITLSKSEAPFFMGGGNTDMKFLNLAAPSEKGLYPSPAGWVTGNDRHGPWIEGCFFEAIADDGPNITGNAYLINRKISRDTLLLQTWPSWQNAVWQKGDRLMFWNPVDGQPLKTATIAEVTTDARALKQGKQSVRLSPSVEGLMPGTDLSCSTHVYNLSCQNSGFVARNNRLVCGRRFGFNVKANNTLIEKNDFEGLSSSAVYLENAPTFWEGLTCENVVVQSNVMVNCGNSEDSARRRRASGVHVNLWRYPSHGSYETSWKGHQNILIRRNTIIDWESVGISADNVINIRIRNNSFENKLKNGFLIKENFAIWAGTDSTEVQIGENRFGDRRRFERSTQRPLK